MWPGFEEVLAKDEFILSTGGGIILSQENRNNLFTDDILTVYLSASPNLLFERLKFDTTRPLLKVDNPLEEINKILNARHKYYSMAKQTINVDNKTIDEIVEEIKCIL